MLPYRIVLSLLALTLAPTCVKAERNTYESITFDNDVYTHYGWTWLVNGSIWSDTYFEWHNFYALSFRFREGVDQFGQYKYGACNGICPADTLFWGLYTEADSKKPATIVGTKRIHDMLDAKSVRYGCFAIGPDGLDSKGKRATGRVPVNCTVTTRATTVAKHNLTHTFTYTVKRGSNPANLTLGKFPSTFKNVTKLSYEVAGKLPAKYKKLTLAIDNFAFGQNPS